MPEPAVAPRAAARRGFGLTVLAGLGAAVLAAVGGNRAWATISDDGSAGGSIAAVSVSIAQATAPLVSSLALVLLAAWGVVLVSRGTFRLVVAWLGLVVGLLLLVTAVAAWVDAPRQVRDAVGSDGADVHHTAWAYVALVAAAVAVAAAGTAVRAVRGWPEMGRRYDAPTADDDLPAPATPVEEQTNLDLWRAIDEGRDPTDRANP